VNYLLSLADYEQDFTDQVDTLVGVVAGESVDHARIHRHGAEEFPERKVEDQPSSRNRLAMFNTILNLLYVMLLLAVIIA
jgi:hypothetical protein